MNPLVKYRLLLQGAKHLTSPKDTTLLNVASTATGGIAGGLIGGGMSTGVGDALSLLSGVAAAIPGPWGAIASAGLAVAGGLTNRMFGSKMNQENIAKVEANINSLNNFLSSASDFDTLAENWANADVGMTFDNSFIGKDGWFSNKAKNKANSLRDLINRGNEWVLSSLFNNAENISAMLTLNLLSNYAAYGGHLFEDGGYTWLDGAKDVASFLPLVGTAMDAYELYKEPSWENAGYLGLSLASEIPFLKWVRGARIASRAAKAVDRASDAASSYQRAADRVARMEAKGTLNPKVVRRAKGIREELFFDNLVALREARQAVMRLDNQKTLERATTYPLLVGDALANEHQIIMNRKAFGGELGTNGADFTNGIIIVGNGGTHESNPNEGVLFGIDKEGTPNLVEEGEVIFRDYVFSNRIKIPKKVQDRHKLKEGLTFAGAALELAKESEERPNDPISQNGLEFLMGDLMKEQELMRNKIKDKSKSNKYPTGGLLGGTTEELLGGTLEELLYGNNSKGGFGGGRTGGGGSSGGVIYTPPQYETVTDTIHIPYVETFNEAFNKARLAGQDTFEFNGGLYNTEIGTNPNNNRVGNERVRGIIIPKERKRRVKVKEGSYHSWAKGGSLTNLRYLPALGSLAGATTDLLGITNKPDYGPSSMVLETGRNLRTPSVKFSPISNYLTYAPFDRDYYINKLNSLSGATRRAIMNTSGGNRAAALSGVLAADNNYLNQLGSLARQAEEYNLALRQLVENFNRATNQYNSEGALKAGIANAENRLKTNNLIMESTITGAKMRQAAKDASDLAKSTNLSNLFDNLGNIGWEEYQRNAIMSNPALLSYYMDRTGNMRYGKRAKGGYLTIKKRKK